MNITKKHVGWFIASTIALTGLPYAGYWYGQKKTAESVIELLELVCTRGGLIQFPDGQIGMCLPSPTRELKQKGLDNNNEA